MPRPTATPRAYLDAHTHFFTYGENVGGPGWIVPLCGIPWQTTRPPVVLDLWPAARGRGRLLHHHRHLGEQGQEHRASAAQTYVWSKHVNFVRFLDLPKARPECFTMAMMTPTRRSRRKSRRPAGGSSIRVRSRPIFDRYGDFIRGSRGEFTVAKDIYVRPMSGWFSDRSVCYLASGRPVVTMRTGWNRFYPVGEGLFGFTERAKRSPPLPRSAPIIRATAAPPAPSPREHFAERPRASAPMLVRAAGCDRRRRGARPPPLSGTA